MTHLVKNSSGVLIKFYRGQKGYLLKDHVLAWDIKTRYLPRTNSAPVHLRGDTVKTIRNSSPQETVCSFWRGRQEQPDNVTDYKPRTKWYNNYAEARQLINLFTPKTKERDIRKYGKPHLTKILFSAIWIHCPLTLSNILKTDQQLYRNIFFSVNGFFSAFPSPPLPMTYFLDCLLSTWSAAERRLSTFCYKCSVLYILMMSSSEAINYKWSSKNWLGSPVIPVFSCQKKKWK